ncbi:MAG TPA: S8 family serine peptidase, partial [Opitutaceae bacterium]
MAAAPTFAAPSFTVEAPNPREVAQGYRDGRVVAKPKPEMVGQIDRMERAEGLKLRARFGRFGHVGVLSLPVGDTVMGAVKRLRATGRYLYVEPDYIRRTALAPVIPNDAQFSSQWGLHNDGSNSGVAGADINAEAGWETLTSAQSVVVGMLDSGAITTHEDLLGNMWVNPAPGTTKSYATVPSSAGGVSSVSETDSLNGLNAVAMSGVPTDDAGHGTHTSGIVGAVGNNGIGVSGVAWQVQLMELKFIDSAGEGSVSDELPCVEYAIAHGVKVINAS